MVKVDIIRSIQFKEGMLFGEAEKLVNILIDTIKERLISGEEVLISGFGKFKLKDKDPRPGRNPKSGELYEVEARRVVVFHPSKVWKEEIADN
ncbi:MAG: HU family DNA-binding protein [SAR324 cluster bacterium]|nr:HU family DNA-binding protein [SAR324 cluster bacterium]